jgi:4-amino-4-deoxy-L-arabinose transferase-like glycosyltransferase
MADDQMTPTSSATPRFVFRIRQWSRLVPALIVVASIAFKGLLLIVNAVPFNGDEAVVALMARHVLAGERPVFFYGQAYLGSTDAWLIALSYSIFGESVLAIRLVQIALFAATLITSYLVAKRLGLTEWAARVAMLLLALPPTMLTLYTTATLGGYGETLLFGNLLILLMPSWQSALWRWLLFGVIAGFAFYTFPLILVYLVPIAIVLLARLFRPRRSWRFVLSIVVMVLFGLTISSAPWWIALIQSGRLPIDEMTGVAVAGTVAAPTFIQSLGVRLINFFLFGVSAWFGLRYPWSAGFVLPAVGVAVLAVYLAALGYAIKRGSGILWGILATLLITFLITPFGGDPSGRYFLPLYLPLMVFTAQLLDRVREQRGTLVGLLIVVILGYNVSTTLMAAAQQPPGITTQFDATTWIDHNRDRELIDFLLANNETRGYTNYWGEYTLAFTSNEQIITSARLPYHLDLSYTPRDDRYPVYSQTVDAAARAFYLTTNHPRLDALIRERLAALGVTFKEHDIGNYHVFYALSRKVRPDELGNW